MIDTFHYHCGKDLSGTLQGAGGVGGLVAVSIAGQYYFPCYDNIGNIVAYVDEAGATAASYTYDAFGNTIASSGSMRYAFPHRFSTKFQDPSTGLYDFGYRWYLPEIGRWANRDPIGEHGGLGLYTLCQNNPVFGFDPNGKSPLDIRANRIRAYLAIGNEEMAAAEAYLLYSNLVQGGYIVEPLAAELLNYWLEGKAGKEEKSYRVSSRHVKNAMLYSKPDSDSPKDQMKNFLCPKVISSHGSINEKFLLVASEGVYYHAFGSFFITFNGSYRLKKGKKYKFGGKWSFDDDYDWHDGLDAEVLGTVIEDSWAILVENTYGAKPFHEEGTWTGSVVFDCSCSQNTSSEKQR